MSDRLHEIVTKAVVGRAERRIGWSHTVPAEGVTGVLGVHVGDGSVAIKEKDGRLVVDIIVDVDLWCGSHKNTKVLRVSVRHTSGVDIRTAGRILGDKELAVRMLGTPRATGVSLDDGKITLSLEVEVLVSISALTRLLVKAFEVEDDVLEDIEDLDDESDSSSYGSGSGSGSGE